MLWAPSRRLSERTGTGGREGERPLPGSLASGCASDAVLRKVHAVCSRLQPKVPPWYRY